MNKKNKNSIEALLAYIDNTASTGNRWLSRANLSKIAKGLAYKPELSLIKTNECLACFEYNNLFDLVLVDSTNQRHNWELWLAPTNTGFLAKLVYSSKHDACLDAANLDKIAWKAINDAKESTNLNISKGWEKYSQNWLASKRIKNIENRLEVYKLGSIRNRLDFSRVLRESILGRTKDDHWDKVSL